MDIKFKLFTKIKLIDVYKIMTLTFYIWKRLNIHIIYNLII